MTRMTPAYAAGYVQALADAEKTLAGECQMPEAAAYVGDIRLDFQADNAEAFDEVGSH